MKIQGESTWDENKWLYTLGAVLTGLFFVGVAFYFYQDFTTMEQNGSSKKVHWAFAFLYNTYGKFGVVGPLAAMSVFGFGCAIKALLTPEDVFQQQVRAKREK
jgi:hypothetical protein